LPYTFEWNIDRQPIPLLEREKSMANEEQLAILKQGVNVWNYWRKKLGAEIDRDGTYIERADLNGAHLPGADLSGAYLQKADLQRANLAGANLKRTHLKGANLNGANLRGANFAQADLYRADLSDADLREAEFAGANFSAGDVSRAILNKSHFRNADLSYTKFVGVDLTSSDFRGADLSGTRLDGAILQNADLTGTKFAKATIGSTIFVNLDLSKAIGLEKALHNGPSRISTDVFALSKGKIPASFLTGCGLSDADIEYAKLFNPDLSNDEINNILYKIYDLRASQAIQISPLFISYSRGDSTFVDKLEPYLNRKGVRFWRDIHDAVAGPLEEQIGRAIRLNPTVLLVLSENSLRSDWVEHEVRKARDLSKDLKRHVLCPVALDDSWKDSRWPKRIMEQIMEYNILDFSNWKDDSKFDGMFRKLIDGLELFYKG
jgi:uncharacterized protein YjbI with pentapeptide repeats